VSRKIEAEGIELRLGASVERFSNGVATLTDGTQVAYDLVVVAVGVRPNTALISDAGGAVGRGVPVTARSETSLPDIYAAGDCTESMDITAQAVKIMAILPNAYQQGHAAGVNMAGGKAAFSASFPMNAVSFFGLHVVSAGTYDGEAWVEATESSYKMLVSKDNRLKGFVIAGDVARAGIYTALIRDQVDLSTIDFELIREKPQLMAFDMRSRAKMLGGEK
jgi:NAD(P)H-nitrite reductase large subunit